MLLVLLASAPLLGWWTYGLFDLDEGFYAAVTGSMIRHHEWITPTLNGHAWFEKPILIYWLAKPAVMVFGPDVGPRLPSVMATVGLYTLVAWFVRRHLGGLAAVMSLFVLASSLLVVSLGRMMMTDSLLVLFFTAAMLTYWESLVADARWRLVTAVCLGLAVLAKGPVALILFGLIVVVYHLVARSRFTPGIAEEAEVADPRSHAEAQSTRRRGGDAPETEGGFHEEAGPDLALTRSSGIEPAVESTGRRGGASWFLGTFILVAVIASWYVPAYLANGQAFVDEFLIKQNLGRFTGGDQAHRVPFPLGLIFYVVVLLLGMFPWILWLPGVLRAPVAEASGQPNTRARELRAFLLVWTAIVFVFFTISSAKLQHYVLPCCPPLAILIGSYFAQKWQGLSREQLRPKLLMTVGWLVAVGVIAQLGFGLWYVHSGQAEAHALALWLRSSDLPVVVYQLPRRQKDLGTGKRKLQETSLPSLSFYVDGDLVEAEKLDEAPRPSLVFTRNGRAVHGGELVRKVKYFSVYLLR
ncbi:MAG: hypothetical protein QOJ65_2008 [Fimbriimonadaceae bacterium]|nr:hypothetical protein [Fimbriimonadaceae bacterium]